MNRRILEHFGIDEKGNHQGALFNLYLTDLKNAISDNQFVAIAGPVGAGKSYLLRHVFSQFRINPDTAPILVNVRNKYKENLTISSILNAVVFDCSDEVPRHDLEARSRQFIRIVGELFVTKNRHICIIIEEAHRLHTNTLRAIKELREDEFAGVSPLFSIILVGHPVLETKMKARSEVFYRSQIIDLSEDSGWMQFNERIQYLKTVYGDAITAEARKRIATLYRMPLDMNFFVERKMDEAYRAGMKQLTGECFAITPEEMLEAMNSGK